MKDSEVDNSAQSKDDESGRSKRSRKNSSRPEEPEPVEKNLSGVKNIQDLITASYSLEMYNNIDTITLWKITPALEDLQSMIGMKSLKETVFEQILYYIQKMQKNNERNEYLHTMIYGDPGVGKSRVAEIIARIYQGLSILSERGPYKVAHRDDLVAGYLGQTALKTNKLLKSCIGGVLFIDEIYALAPRDKDDRDSYSNEALDTLTPFLSEHKHEFCCIGAGYEREIENAIFTRNPGMRRRFPWVHKIEKYTPYELALIFIKMTNDINWSVSCDVSFIERIIQKNIKFFPSSAGDIETYLTKCKISHSTRVFGMSKDERFILNGSDLERGIEHIKKNKKTEELPNFYI